MKKNAFTLVELLAVIIILGLIGLLIIPKVTETIKDSRKNTYEISANALSRTATNYYLDQKMQNKNIQSCTYDFTNNTNTCEGLEFTGKKPDSGKITVKKNGEIAMAIQFDKYCYSKEYKNDEIQITDYDQSTCGENSSVFDYDTYKVARTINNIKYYDTSWTANTPRYYNPTTLEKCDDYNISNSAFGFKNGCMKWYVYSENADGTVNMILDHNVNDPGLEWISSTDYSNGATLAPTLGVTNIGTGSYGKYGNVNKGPLTVLKSLKASTSLWNTKVPTTFNYTSINVNTNYTVNYSEYKARIITAQEIANIKGETWDETSANPTQTIRNMPEWLSDNLTTATEQNVGYWTISANAYGDSNVWVMDYDLKLESKGALNLTYYGIRPVITVNKSDIE